ncbi:FecR family protein [Paraburkholderia sp. ZP32-5]|uniref:FecR family protein n=1 Tax=Paraburkholderia sp. ZP32-5 TaxID=2883245 RepID=UPI001F48D62C|nr:FecR domain-containing protein [Paraburkholderia sp. ZP32-5]
MSKTDDPSTEIARQAQAWLVRLRSGRATRDDAQAFQRWCDEHPDHARVARVLSRTWTQLGVVAGEVRAEQRAADRAADARAARALVPRPARRAFVGFAVAAGASWLAFRPPMQLWPALGDFASDYRTETGEQRQVALSAHVVVEMNTQTRIDLLRTHDMSDGQHGIDLLAGEAEVVASAPALGVTALPVVVKAGSGRLQASAARFDVRRTGDNVCVTCVSGELAFEHPRGQLTLSASQQLMYDDRNVRPVSRVDAGMVTAWRRGVLMFKDAPLTDVVEEINRYRPGRLILNNAGLKDARVHAQFALARLDDAIDLICRITGAHAVRLPGRVVLFT